MILDTIIEFLALIYSIISEAFLLLFVPIANFIVASIEAIVGLFVAGFSLTRLERKRKTAKLGISRTATISIVLIATGIIAPAVMNRKITMIAKDGQSLPFAEMIIHTSNGDQHVQTDKTENIRIPRFGTFTVTVKDPRYEEKNWAKKEIGAELIVERTLLGSGLNHLSRKLLEPAEE